MHSYLKKDLTLHHIQINNPGPHSELALVEGPNPGFNESQILVRVKATALNRADLMQKYGKYPLLQESRIFPDWRWLEK